MSSINEQRLKDLFSYHPPVDETTKKKYEAVNKASVDFAIALAQIVESPAELTILLRKIQEVRMLANQAVTFNAENLSYRSVFFDK